jgi:hypothetical protein
LLFTAGGDIFATTGAGGTLTANGIFRTTFGGGNGNITIKADNVTIADAIDAGTGIVTIAPVTLARNITIGSEVAGTLSLTQAEDDLLRGRDLLIGRTDGTGNIQLTGGADLTWQSINFSLSLLTGGAGTITQTAASTLDFGNLYTQTGTGTVTLGLANAIGRYAATSAGGKILVNSNGTFGSNFTFAASNLNNHTGIDTTAAGAVPAGADVSLAAADGILIVEAPINAGTVGTVRLVGATGIGQTAAVITSAGLSAFAASSNIILVRNNLVAGTFAARADNGSVHFRNTSTAGPALIIGTVAADGAFAQIFGVSAVNGDITVANVNRGLAIDAPVQTFTPGKQTLLRAGGDIRQAATGPIITSNLLVESTAGLVELATDRFNPNNLVANDVRNLAAVDTSAGKLIRFNTSGNLNIVTIGGNSLVDGAVGVSTAYTTTLVASGSIALRAAGDLTLVSNVVTGDVDFVTGNAVSGAIRLQSGGVLSTTTGFAALGYAHSGASFAAQAGALGLRAATAIHGTTAADRFEARIGPSWGSLNSQNFKAIVAADTVGTAQIVNRALPNRLIGKWVLGAVAAESVIFTPDATNGANVIDA